MSGRHHNVKILPEYYIAVEKGIKTFEIRFNDRNYKVGDILHLQEFCGGQYTGRELTKEICYMIDSPDYCKEGFAVLGIKDVFDRRRSREHRKHKITERSGLYDRGQAIAFVQMRFMRCE